MGKIEKVGDKLQMIKLIEDVISRRAKGLDNARKKLQSRIDGYEARIKELERTVREKNGGSPIRRAILTTLIFVVLAIFSHEFYEATLQIERQNQQLAKHRKEIYDLSSQISKFAEEQSREIQKLKTTDCSKVTVSDSKVVAGNGGLIHSFPKADVFCDFKTDGGGWIVFQRRMDGSEDFYKGWEDYVHGFGNPEREFWLGLEALYKLTNNRRYKLRIDFEDWKGEKRYAKYSFFKIHSSGEKYRLNVTGYTGDAGDSLSPQSEMMFSTKDVDNDLFKESCAVSFKGAWWYNACHLSNLNAQYLKGTHKSYANGVNWSTWRGFYYSLKFVKMKIRPIT